MAPPESATVVLVGAGFSGLGMARKLQLAGIDDFVILEREDEIGGTWRDNRYPGVGCDVRSHLYSWSFELNPDWSRRYARGPEILRYMLDCVERWGLRPHIRFGANLSEAAWDDERSLWVLTCTDGRVFEAPFQISGVGALRDPKIPDLPGLDTFAGPSIHSARWDSDVDLTGKRVAVVGTGASAVQIVPEIAPQVAQLTVFQRTAGWVFPRMDRAIPSWRRWLYRHVPGLTRLVRAIEYVRYESRYPAVFGPNAPLRGVVERWARFVAERTVDDPETAANLIPDYDIGCKRALVSDNWLPAFNRDNVRLVPHGIDAVTPTGVTCQGKEHTFDVILWCTGFKLDRLLGTVQIRGVDGRSLDAFWGSRPRSHLGILTPGFPNSFFLLGPNTALGHNSVVVMIEGQIRYILQAIRWSMKTGRRVDVRPEVLDAFLAEMDEEHVDQVWMTGCQSWYLNADGENFTIWPGSTLSYLWRTRRFDPKVCS